MLLNSYVLNVVAQAEMNSQRVHLDSVDLTQLQTNILFLRERGCIVTLIQAVTVVDTVQ